MVIQRKYVLKQKFQGLPKRSDFDIVETKLPPIGNGQFLVKTEFISVDPYLRLSYIENQFPYDQFGFQVGRVLESKNPKYPVGTRVVSHKGWCDHVILDNESSGKLFDNVYKIPDLKGLSPSLAVGAVGMPGASAYFGFLDVCQPKYGETVAVSGAAGAVGTIVGQIAKIKGCKVIGFTGSDDKAKWLVDELGFDKAINYKTADISASLKEAAPQGIDCYFDNVGGEISSIIMNQMNTRGRISVCGSISCYNEPQMPEATIVQPALVFKELRIEGFAVRNTIPKWNEAFVQLVQWIVSGQLKAAEHVTEGFDNVVEAFVGMLAGENSGKAVVRV